MKGETIKESSKVRWYPMSSCCEFSSRATACNQKTQDEDDDDDDEEDDEDPSLSFSTFQVPGDEDWEKQQQVFLPARLHLHRSNENEGVGGLKFKISFFFPYLFDFRHSNPAEGSPLAKLHRQTDLSLRLNNARVDSSKVDPAFQK